MRLLLRSITSAGIACATVLSLAGSSGAAATGAGASGAAGASAASSASTTVPAATAARLAAALRAGTLDESTGTHRVCATNHLGCAADVVTAPGSTTPLSSSRPIGYGPRDLATAYSLGGTPQRSGTIAIVDLAAYPTVAGDLASYRRQYALPACTRTSRCLTVERYDGGPELQPATSRLGRLIEEEIAVETSLDLDMASAACPHCKLILLQVPFRDLLTDGTAGLHAAILKFATAVRTAKAQGADSVSMSYGFPTDKYTNTGPPAKLVDVTGMAVTASTGDSGFNATFTLWPSSLRSVIAVGGTSLTRSQTTRRYSEAAWDGAGSGCTVDLAPAFGQPSSVARNCGGYRASADISAVADPQTGVAVYDTYAPFTHTPYRWIVVGGTSASSPFVGGLYARAGVSSGVHGPNRIYAAPSAAFSDVTTGANGPRGLCSHFGIAERVCMSDTGWDGPTGLGTPVGLRPFR